MSVFSGPADWWTDGTDQGRTYIATRGIVQSNLMINLDAAVYESYSGTGSIWTNLANTNSNGTLQTPPTFSTNTFVFDGVDDAIALVPDFFVQNDAKAFSISTWSKSNQTTGGTLFGQQNTNTPSTASGWVPVVYLQNDGKIRFEPFWTGSSSNAILSTAAVNDNVWHYVVCTFSSGTAKLYIDTIYQNQLTGLAQSAYASPHYYFIGAGYAGGRGLGTNFFAGSISRFTFYNKELNTTEILQNFNALRGRFGV